MPRGRPKKVVSSSDIQEDADNIPRPFALRNDGTEPDWAKNFPRTDIFKGESDIEKSRRFQEAVQTALLSAQSFKEHHVLGSVTKSDLERMCQTCSFRGCQYGYEKMQGRSVQIWSKLTFGHNGNPEKSNKSSTDHFAAQHESFVRSTITKGVSLCNEHYDCTFEELALPERRFICWVPCDHRSNHAIVQEGELRSEIVKKERHCSEHNAPTALWGIVQDDGTLNPVHHYHIADPRSQTIKVTCCAHDALKTLSNLIRDRKKEIDSRSKKTQKDTTIVSEEDRPAENDRTTTRSTPIEVGSYRVSANRSGASATTQGPPAQEISHDAPVSLFQARSALPAPPGIRGPPLHEFNPSSMTFGDYNLQNPPLDTLGPPAPSLPPGDYVPGTLINNWRDHHSRLSSDPDRDIKQMLILSDPNEWTCWSCGSGIRGRPADNANEDGSEWQVAPEYVKALDNWTRYGTHICSDNTECQRTREDFMKDRSVNVRCVNTKGCMAEFAYLDNDIGSQGFRVQDIDDPAKTYHCCSPPCQASISLLMADKEYREHRRLNLAREIKDGSAGRSKRSREDNIHSLSSAASSSPTAPASTAGSLELSHLDLDSHSTHENDRERKRRVHYDGTTSTHSSSGWTAVNL